MDCRIAHRVVVLVMLAAMAVGCASQRSSREVRKLDSGWRFVASDTPGGELASTDDHAWQQVTLPHTWNALDAQDGGGDYRRGPAWYRLRFRVPKLTPGKVERSVYVRFQGAATVADVFVNGTHVGQHRGNFGAFTFDVTDLLGRSDDGENLLAVRVDNSKFADVAPLGGDFSICGGLYRRVELIVTDALHVSPLDDASSGVYLRQVRVDDDRAVVEVTTKVRNTSAKSKRTTVKCGITDRDGKVVATTASSVDVAAHASADAIASVEIAKPRLWRGAFDPYLYTATVDVSDGSRVADRVVQPLGLRSFRIDPKEGLLLNGVRYQVRGVNRHQDRLDKGWAISEADQDEDFRLIREIGATGVRLAHYPHSDYAYGLSDHLGLVIWAELPLVVDVTKTDAFADNAKQQLREMIKQNFNHPSILFWSLYNELSMKEGTDFSYEQKLVTELNTLARELDPTRITVAATHKQNLNQPVNWIPDATAFNRYYGWYEGQPADWARQLDSFHTKFPDKRIGISEYGAGASIYQHEVNPVKPPRAGGAWHPEEWQAICHEQAWLAMRDRPWLWGTFAWNMFDFACDDRKEGDELGRNDKGLVTYDRQTRKDAFYFYKASWRDDEAVIHIAAKRFDPRPAVTQEVKVYSNCESVELFHNERSLGRKTSRERIFVWPEVSFAAGKNEFRAVGKWRGKHVADSCNWSASRQATTRMTVTR